MASPVSQLATIGRALETVRSKFDGVLRPPRGRPRNGDEQSLGQPRAWRAQPEVLQPKNWTKI